MEPQNTQVNNQQKDQMSQDFGGLNPDQLGAALSFATMQGEQNLPPPDAMNPAMQSNTPPQQPQDAPQPTEDPKQEDNKLNDLEGKMEQKMEILRTEIKDTVKTEIESLRKSITDALDNEQN